MTEPTQADVTALIQTLVPTTPLTGETPLLSSGLLDSFLLLDLVENLEDRYGIAALASEVTPDLLDTPAQVLAYVLRKQAEA
ncbi:MAG: hypothetical protein JKY65_28545 [Planctomycetes bacterium]|nr:hypothetical protein [Planctomycetota bacterium]